MLLDPFCGSGTVLMEAMLMGIPCVGSDRDSAAVKATEKNLAWLQSVIPVETGQPDRQAGIQNPKKIIQSSAEQIHQQLPPYSIDVIVTEPFLGPSMRQGTALTTIKETIRKLTKIYRNSFVSFSKLLKQGGRVVIVFPVFEKKYPIELAPELEKFGFTVLAKYWYARPDQRLAREIYIFQLLNRK